ncbi:MAG: Gfo/Idh/MocA family oxidoreductase [Nitratireductor sp.]|nr:Gfo/Idh/MocA family oxidoreductase [Nitratireductor sp.]MCB1454776.1 Gfo/Idh/MocA family oxidoreductase [Nitratireductor sp.]
MKRILVAGAGLIGIRHIAEVGRSAHCRLVGIIEPQTQTALQFGVPVFASIADVDVEADGIILATPTDLHAAQAIEAVDRGLDVLVEKPVAHSLEAAMQMDAAARRAGRRILVGHHRRHHPRVELARQLLQGGRIGQPLVASCLWTARKPDEYFVGNWRSQQQGSPVLINAVHDIDVLRHFLGEIRSIAAFGTNSQRKTDRVETASIMMQFADGCVATIVLSDASPGPWGFESGTGENPNIGSTGQDMLFISGSSGAMSFPSLTVWGGSEDWSVAPQPASLPPATETGGETPLQRQLAHFVAVMKRTAEPLVDALDAGRTLAAALEAERQIRQGGWNIADHSATSTREQPS